MVLKHLQKLTLRRFQLKGDIIYIVDALSNVQMSALNCLHCESITLQELLFVLDQVPMIQYCNVNTSLSSYEEVFGFAKLANRLAGKVNLCLDSLELVPSDLLQYPRSMYRVAFPSGQMQ